MTHEPLLMFVRFNSIKIIRNVLLSLISLMKFRWISCVDCCVDEFDSLSLYYWNSHISAIGQIVGKDKILFILIVGNSDYN
jgi:hypothetical protein